MRERFAGLLFLGVAFLALSCSGPLVTSVGESDDLVIVGDEASIPRGLERITGIMQVEVPWLQDEPLFQPTVVSVEGFEKLHDRRQILLVGVWGEGGVPGIVSRHVRGVAPGDPPRLEVVEDVWAQGQIVCAIMANDEDELLTFLDENGKDVASRIEAATVTRLARRLREDAKGAGVTAELERRFGWAIAPPSDYEFFTTHADEGFVFFRRTRPDRTISVFWQPGEPDYVTDEYAIAKRSELGEKYFDGDEIEWKRELTVEHVDFNGLPAIALSGWWANRKLIGGGPFRSYCFYEPAEGLVYLIDAGLFAPGEDKTALMRGLDAALWTFQVPRR
jgi:hypothetical protein